MNVTGILISYIRGMAKQAVDPVAPVAPVMETLKSHPMIGRMMPALEELGVGRHLAGKGVQTAQAAVPEIGKMLRGQEKLLSPRVKALADYVRKMRQQLISARLAARATRIK